MEINMKGGRGVLFLGYFLKFFKQFETLNARQGNLIIDSVRRGSASPVENKSMREVKPHFLAFFPSGHGKKPPFAQRFFIFSLAVHGFHEHFQRFFHLLTNCFQTQKPENYHKWYFKYGEKFACLCGSIKFSEFSLR